MRSESLLNTLRGVLAALSILLTSTSVRSEGEFRVIQDDRSGIRIELPLEVLAVNKATKWGQSWSSRDGSITIDTLGLSDRTIQDLYETLRMTRGRTLTHSELGESSFVLQGKDVDGTHFYVEAQQNGGFIRGFSLVYSEKRQPQAPRLIQRIKGSFQALAAGGQSTAAPSAKSTSATPAPGTPAGTQKINVVPSLAKFGSYDDAMLSPNGRLAATIDANVSIRLWDITTGRLLRTLHYFALFSSVSFLPDSKHIASGHKDGSIKIWDVTSGDAVVTLKASEKEIWSIWIDDKGEYLVSGDDDGIIKVWDIARLKAAYRFGFRVPGPDTPRIRDARLSSDRSRLIALNDDTVKIFNVQTAKVEKSFKIPKDWTFVLRSILDEELLMVQSTQECALPTIGVIRVSNGPRVQVVDKPPKCEKPKDDHNSRDARLYRSEDRRQLILVQDRLPLKFWNIETGRVERSITWPSDTNSSILDISHGLGLALAYKDGTISIHTFENGTSVQKLKSYGWPASIVMASHGGRHVLLHHSGTGAERPVAQLWQVSDVAPRTITLPSSPDIEVWDFVEGDNVALASLDKGQPGEQDRRQRTEIILFSIENGHEQQRFALPGIKSVHRARLSPDGKWIFVLGEDDKEKDVAFLVESKTKRIRLTFKATEREQDVSAVTFSADSTKFALGRWNGRPEIWSIQTLQRIKLLEAPKDDDFVTAIRSLAFSDDSQLLVAGSRDSGVYLWNVSTGRLARAFPRKDYIAGHVNFSSVAISHDRKLVVAGLAQRAVSSGDIGAESGIKVWDRETGNLKFTLEGHGGGVGAVTFSPDDGWIVSANYDGTIRYWDRANGTMVAAFSSAADGRWLIVTDRGFFAGSPDSDDLINVVRGLDAYSVSQFYEHLYQPDLVRELLNGDREAKYSEAAHKLDLPKILESGPAPALELVEKQTEVLEQAVRIKVRIKDEGGGIGARVVWRVDGRAQGETRAPPSPQTGDSSVVIEQVLKVDPGQHHSVQVVAYNKAGLLASVPLHVWFDKFGASITEQRMHVLAIGITEYEKKEWRLDAAAKDAKDFADAMETAGKGLFAKVKVTLVQDHQATAKGIEQAFAKIAKDPDLKPTDVFVLYLAGHGRYDGARYYFVPQELNTDMPPKGKGHRIQSDAIGQEVFQRWIASVQVDKRIVVIDTCESAEGTAAMIRQLASPRLTAMEQLQHATGDNLLAAAGQAAFESNKLGHGLLTYAVLESLTKKQGADKDEQVTFDMVASHAIERVPVLSREIFGQEQWPIRKNSPGSPIPIGFRRVELNLPNVATPIHRNFVLTKDALVRTRPDPSAVSDPSITLETPMIVNILGYNEKGDWVRIQWGSGLGVGWVPSEAVKEPKKGPQ
jgi:WD40 repeat protein